MSRALHAARLRAPDDLPGRPVSVLDAPPATTGPAFTTEQRAAVADRSGSRLLAANAGSGKTAVMVERFVEAVLEDGVAVGTILALTFTEKAAGELRERIRRRFSALGRDDLAREAEGAWVGTIDGFCARVLRAHPLAAGLDPRFEVLDALAAQRLAGTAFERALDAFAAERGAPAVDLAAAYGPGLRDLVLRAHAALRSRGWPARLRIPAPAPPPDPAATAAALAVAARHLEAVSRPGKRVTEAIAALEAARTLLEGLAPGEVPPPVALDPAALGTSAAALKEAPCEDYRDALAAYRQACADHHGRTALELLDGLLATFDAAYTELRRARAAVDFADLELCVRDLLVSDLAVRERWARRFELIMVDEFQDTNRLQLDVLEALERDNLFAVGDEFQAIYGFRHADVTIFRDRRAALGAEGTRSLRTNFRSREELLDVLDVAFAPTFGAAFTPLVAGRPEPAGGNGGGGRVDGELRLFDPDRAAPPVEFLVTDTTGWEEEGAQAAVEALGLEALSDSPPRRAEARLVARRLREEVDSGTREGDIVVLVRATASLRLLEQALEEEGLATYVVGGRGYWSAEQVRDGLAYLRVLANPLDEEALYGVLASPFGGLGADALVLLSRAGREGGRGAWAALAEVGASGAASPPAWARELEPDQRERLAAVARLLAAERARAPRVSAEVLLEHAVAATGYDLAILARPDGERRLANARKLMRLAREFERSEGPDLRGFLAFAATQELDAAREGEAPLEGEGFNAIRLMTIHRAKGLEFDVVCVADLGREPARNRDALLVGRDGTAGLRLTTLGAGKGVPALAYEPLAAELSHAEGEEERRLFYVAMTRARERLILSGTFDATKWPEPSASTPPIAWIARALLGDAPGEAVSVQTPEREVEHRWEGRPARVRARLLTPTGAALLTPGARRRSEPGGTALPVTPTVARLPAAPVAPVAATAAALAPDRLSYTSLGDYAKCPYRFHLRRVLRLPDVPEPPPAPGTGDLAQTATAACGLDPRLRGVLVHALLEDLAFRRPVPPGPRRVAELAAAHGATLAPAGVADVTALVGAFARSPLCGRLARAGRSVRREAPFAFALEDGPAAPLLTGVVDVLAHEPDGSVLVVDYKTDRLEPGDTPHAAVQRAYGVQRRVYALAALRDGAPRVEIAHCYLERPEDHATATFTQDDVAELADALRSQARGVLAAEYPVTDAPHRELCGTCPGRRALCSHPEERTLRPAAPAP